MIRDLISRIRRLLDERTGHDYVWVTHAHLTELVDRCEAAEAFGAACNELAEARRFPGRDDARLMNAEENHEVHGERFAALCIPKEADRG